jgi:CO/xanthine dehydrogenase Mo-binding subunit
MSYIGQSVRRVEDRPLLTGSARFAADISFPNQLHMRVVRSPIAHGRLRDVDIGVALAMPGVLAVWTSKDVADIPPIDYRMTRVAGLEPYRQPILATDVVRYVGEPYAVVFAGDPYAAEDAAAAVFADFDELAPLLDATATPGWFDEHHSTEAAVIQKEAGDTDGAFAAAHAIVELRLSIGRQSGVPLENRGALASYDSMAGRLEMFGAAKVPHYNRNALASMLGVPATSIVLKEGHVGGGFGIRGELYPEDVLVCLGALRLGLPVKWIEDRREHLIAANHSRDQVHHIRAAVASDGWVYGVIDEFWLSQGAYVRTHAATVADLTAALLPGPYMWPAYHVVGHIRLTNKTPAGTYRAPGRFEGTYVRERLMDAIAEELSLHPVQVRRRNLIPPDAMPFSRGFDALGTDVIYDSGDYGGLLDRVADHIDFEELEATLHTRRASRECVGLGIALFVEKSGLGPFDGVRVSIDRQGDVQVATGAASVGQGVETVLAQICAEVLGVELGRITVRHGQTDDLAFGMGAFASRVTVMAGSATHIASRRVRDKALEVAARMLEANPSDLTIEDGRIFTAGSPEGPSITLAEIATTLIPGPETADMGLSAEGWFETDHMTYPYGLHVAQVRIDQETGAVTVERYVVGYDVGRAINPQLVEGQIAGAVAQGVGGALLEEFCYDEVGQPLSSGLMDYLMPTVLEMPEIEVVLREDAPSPLNPLGVKGAGEGGLTAAGGAIANAISNALGRRLGVRSLPIGPEDVLALAHESQSASASSSTVSSPTSKKAMIRQGQDSRSSNFHGNAPMMHR